MMPELIKIQTCIFYLFNIRYFDVDYLMPVTQEVCINLYISIIQYASKLLFMKACAVKSPRKAKHFSFPYFTFSCTTKRIERMIFV